MQLVNGAQLLNITPLFHSCASITSITSIPGPVIVIFPLANIYASL